MTEEEVKIKELEKIALSSLRKYFIVTFFSALLLAGTLLWAALSTAPTTPTSYPPGLDGDQFRAAYELVRQWYIEATVYRNLNLLLLIVGVILLILLSQTSALDMEAKSKYCFLAIVSVTLPHLLGHL